MALDSDSKQFSPPSVRGLFDTLCRACGLAYKLHQYNGNQEAAQALVDQVLLVLVKVGVSFALAGDVCKDAKLVSAKIATSLATSAIVVAHEGFVDRRGGVLCSTALGGLNGGHDSAMVVRGRQGRCCWLPKATWQTLLHAFLLWLAHESAQ